MRRRSQHGVKAPPSNKEQTPLGHRLMPTRGFTAVLSVLRGTPPIKPLECKIWLSLVDSTDQESGAEPTGEDGRLLFPQICLVRRGVI